jgi:hypothetical protein
VLAVKEQKGLLAAAEDPGLAGRAGGGDGGDGDSPVGQGVAEAVVLEGAIGWAKEGQEMFSLEVLDLANGTECNRVLTTFSMFNLSFGGRGFSTLSLGP